MHGDVPRFLGDTIDRAIGSMMGEAFLPHALSGRRDVLERRTGGTTILRLHNATGQNACVELSFLFLPRGTPPHDILKVVLLLLGVL